jgi:hypothetical protein
MRQLDAVRLYASDSHSVLELDLSRGTLRSWSMPVQYGHQHVTGLAMADDGVRVFAVCAPFVAEIDTRTDAVTVLLTFAQAQRSGQREVGVMVMSCPTRAAPLWIVQRERCCSRTMAVTPL